MKKQIYKILCFAAVLGTLISCNVEEFSDLNNPEVGTFEENLSRGDLRDLMGGILYSSRVRLGTYFDDCGVVGREYWRFSSSDPRFTTDLLGGGTSILDNNTFYITNPWASRYRTIKNANLILGFLDGQDLSANFTPQEISATKGFLKTFIAYELLLNLNLTDQGGVRVDVADPDNLGPFLSKSESLTAIQTTLAEAASDLSNGGSAFPFPLSSGFTDFNTPTSFRQANKAIAARVAMYQGNPAQVISHLNDSFFSLDPSKLFEGVYYNFTTDQTDILNPMYFPINATTAGARVTHPTFVNDAESGDSRLSKVALRELVNEDGDLEVMPLTLDGLTGSYVVFRYTSNTAPIPLIRNEELILLYAEANITLNPGEAVAALNLIRQSAGLLPYTGTLDPAALVNEMLTQRRYSLYAEGHRWIDMRRYNRLGTLPIDRVDANGEPDNVWEMFPVPLTENQ